MQGLIRRIAVLAVVGVLIFPTTLAQAQSGPSFRTPTSDELTKTRAGSNDWITYGGSIYNQRYSTLDQVNTTNVKNLRGAWMTRLGSGKGSKYKFEADPIVVDGVMYIPTGNDDIFALEAKNGRKLWEYSSDIPQTNDLICCGWDNRGVAAGEGKIFSGQLDGSFVALDQKTGKIAWRTQLEDYHDGYSITGATRYLDGLVYTGMSGAENGVRGRVYALDAKTGAEVWRFWTIPSPGDIGSDTWPSPTDSDPVKRDAYLHGGATVWQAISVDPDLKMAYFSTGNAGPDYDGSVRPGDNLFSASIVALDSKTGQYKWHFQEAKHDIWDFDAPSPTVLFDQMYNGVMRKGMYECGKTGWCYFLDRTNGEPLVGIEQKAVPQEPLNATAATQPYPVGDPVINTCPEPLAAFPLSGCIFTPFWETPVLLRNTGGGGTEWSPTSFSPQTGFVYVNAAEQNSTQARRGMRYENGKRYTGGANVQPLGSAINSTFTALDSRTNKIAWQKYENMAQGYGAVSTAGGLVFRGKVDGNLVAHDARTGDDLWTFQTGWGVSAPPMTYAVDGVQYVVVASGGGRGGVTTLDGDAVWAFTLGGTIDELPAPPVPAKKVEITGAITKIGDAWAAPGNFFDDKIFDGSLNMEDYRFFPNRVQVPPGTTVTWMNVGATIHTATDSKGAFDTGDVPGGANATFTFNTAGTYTFACTPHPWMIGQVIVQ
jgi:quinohemoprotein ethanol dehydrogenase